MPQLVSKQLMNSYDVSYLGRCHVCFWYSAVMLLMKVTLNDDLRRVQLTTARGFYSIMRERSLAVRVSDACAR